MSLHVVPAIRLGCCALVACSLLATAIAEEPARSDRTRLTRPIYRVGERIDSPAENLEVGPQQAAQAEHPLTPVIGMAKDALASMESNIQDYSATLIKRERIGDTLGEHEYLFVKIRHKPFSAYTYFLGPERVKGQEAIYVEGKNDNCIVGHGVGVRRIAGTVRLAPTSMLAMAGNKYPITDIGLYNLTEKLVTVGQADMQYGECDVKTFPGAKINGRSVTCIQVTHPVPRKNFRFNIARIFYDDELKLITRYEAYDWPQQQGGKPILTEEYTYVNLKINNNFTDADFDENNPAYGYR